MGGGDLPRGALDVRRLEAIGSGIHSSSQENAMKLALPMFAFSLTLATTVTPEGFRVTSTLITGEQDAVLVDSQFTLAEAHRLVAKILESKKTLKTILITHGHPDHYFGLEVVRAAFPQARIVAAPAVIVEIVRPR
jgi:glyoxylase-like metal-dependent hydrolase (beta-lactamase superfamily II)